MFKRMRSFLVVTLLIFTAVINAQVTTATISGKVMDMNNEAIIGATVLAVHEPSGTRYGAITNLDGLYSIQGMKTGGPYKVEFSYVGYQTVVFKGINLQLGDNYVLNAAMKESSELLDEVVITASANSNMKSSRSGAMMNVNSAQMSVVPTVSRNLSDIMRLSPQGSATTNGFAVGGGNYRQSNVTIDGAQFNNTFGLGSGNLPGGGNPISLDALEQVSVSITPYDVRQSGFNGGAINAVTKSGTNLFNGTVYGYFTGEKLIGDNVNGNNLSLEKSHKYTYGASIGGPIIKDKLFFFVNGEYEDNLGAGPSGRAGNGETPYTNTNRRPKLSQLESLTSYTVSNYSFPTGAWQNYNVKTPSYRILARVDWNINDNNKFNVRFTKSNKKTNSGATNSRSPLIVDNIYGGNQGIYGSNSYYGMSALSSRYYSEYHFTSVAGELNSRFGKFTNTLRGTYSYQDQPRSNEYGNLPTVEILMSDGQGQFPTWALMGNDPFTMGNLSQTKNIVLTDELNATFGKHNLFAGFQYEYNHAVNGYAQMGAGYYAFEATADQIANNEWEDVFAATPRVFAITYGNNAAHSMFEAKMSVHQYSLYLQDNMDLSENFKLSLGLRMELPVYPNLDNNFNQDYWNLRFGRHHYATDQVPDNSVSFSPRVGFNWDMSKGERKYILRGGTGIFVGRMPFVWLVSAVGNSGMGQTTYAYYGPNTKFPSNNAVPSFTTNRADMLQQINATSSTSVPRTPTILGNDLQMPKTWKTSLAFDAKLPGDVDFTLEGIYNKDLNPCVVSNMNTYWDGESTIELSNYDTRNYMSSYQPNNQAYVINNAGNKAYYWSINAQVRKLFDFGLYLSASYTRSKAKSYTEGIGDQVTSAYTNYRNSINAVNDNETGYATYVAPNRILLTASYKLKEGKKAASTFSLIYDGSENGFMSGYSYTRFSYIFSSNVTGEVNAPGNLLYIPRTREELNDWNFTELDSKGNTITFKDVAGNKVTYTPDMQRDDFWTYINQDSYLKNRKGQYTERGGAKMNWHHQVDFRFNQDFYLTVGKQKHTLQLGCDITNLPNLLNNKWGNYKQVISNSLLTYQKGAADNGSEGAFTYNLANGARHLKTFQDYQSTWSTYQVMFSIRYIFN